MTTKDHQEAEDHADMLTPKIPAGQDEPVEVEVIQEVMPLETAAQSPSKALTKTPVNAVSQILPIAATSVDEAERMAAAFCYGGMVPKSYEVTKSDDKGKKAMDWVAIKSRLIIAIVKGSAVGFDPVTAVNTIYVVNGRPSIYGDGAKALVQRSGKLEWEKVDTKGEWSKNDFEVTVTLKRRGQDEPYVRTFTQKMAKSAGIIRNVWKVYPERMTYWRAWTWAARDGFSDATMGLAIVEEFDELTAQKAAEAPDTSSLDDGDTNADAA